MSFRPPNKTHTIAHFLLNFLQNSAIDGDCYKEMFDKLHAEIVAHLAISERVCDGPAMMHVGPLIADEWYQSTEEPPI